MSTAKNIAALSAWIDRHNEGKGAEAILWGRVAKIAEEHGEATKELIALTGQNPRKPATDDKGPLIEELLDVAVTALGAVEHLTGNTGLSIAQLHHKIRRVADRAGVTDNS